MNRLALAIAVGIVGLIAVAEPAAKMLRGPGAAGEARVIDGDTIKIGSVTIRLWGMDAPEMGQRCGAHDCGRMAADRLTDIIAGAPVQCAMVDTDRYGRMVATCTANGTDLGEAMVRDGYAIDYPMYSRGRYAPAEDEARRARRGLWPLGFENPADWRRKR